MTTHKKDLDVEVEYLKPGVHKSAPPETSAPDLFTDPFTPESLSKEPKIQPKGLKVVHKTAGDLMGEYPHSPPVLVESMADYLNAEYAKGNNCRGCLGDTTNHYFIFG